MSHGQDGYAKVSCEPIEVDLVLRSAAHPGSGAVASFMGIVRDDGIDGIEIEAYEEVAQADLEEIRRNVMKRYPVNTVSIQHRTGHLSVGETILLIVVSAGHRREALGACGDALEMVKERVPIWKKEFTPEGERWVKGNHE